MMSRILCFFVLLLSTEFQTAAEKQYDHPPQLQVFQGSDCESPVEKVPTIAIGYPSLNISLVVQQELEAVLFRRPDVGLVTCAPPGIHNLRLRSLLVLSFPLEKNPKPILDVVKGDCGNQLFVYVSTYTNGPSLLRKSLEPLFEETVSLSSVSSIEISSIFGEKLWDAGWKVAMIDCSHLGANQVHFNVQEDNTAWEKAISPEYRNLHDYVEAHNTFLVESRMRLLYPFTMNNAEKPPTPRPPDQFEPGITVVVMTYNNIENANAAKSLLEKVALIEYNGVKIIREVILLWNSDAKQTFQPDVDRFLDTIENGRVVIAPTNDLQNRMNMDLVQPKTAALMALDDDSPIPPADIIGQSYHEWSLNNGISLQGLQDSRGAPSTISLASHHGRLFSPTYAYLAHPNCVSGRAWMVENPFIYHQDYARAFSSHQHDALHKFILLQPSHPDDISFGTFVNWASEMPAICIDENPGKYVPHSEAMMERQRQHMLQIRYQNQHAPNHQSLAETRKRRSLGTLESSLSEEDDASDSRRRRLGLSGGSAWLFLRTHGAMWVLYYFGGFYNPNGCWISARASGVEENIASQEVQKPVFEMNRATHADCMKKKQQHSTS